MRMIGLLLHDVVGQVRDWVAAAILRRLAITRLFETIFHVFLEIWLQTLWSFVIRYFITLFPEEIAVLIYSKFYFFLAVLLLFSNKIFKENYDEKFVISRYMKEIEKYV